ncbi:hypothetical protein DHEL01_v209502 [Diaporthe helianthi]|uniref:Uncharacterized protein n=1 Tax=Diaporthe helianthi TaxID=158607 RepID=A0A2P5HPB7_DIAHE|nr:hypothetical protein DHEL01_v209502 [Diaporthe helianthi]
MSLKIRCSSCSRGTSGKHNLCSDCRAASTERIVYVTDSGERIEVSTIERPTKSSSSSSSRSKRRESKSSRTSSAGTLVGTWAVMSEILSGMLPTVTHTPMVDIRSQVMRLPEELITPEDALKLVILGRIASHLHMTHTGSRPMDFITLQHRMLQKNNLEDRALR